jgi:pimeloyl-ACP methyl ester carboxylesterase
LIQIVLYKNKYALSYAEYGNPNGYPILIQHGLIASIKGAGVFNRLIQSDARLICIARPGYGESSPYEMKTIGEWAELVGVLIDKLRLTRFDVLGMSSGAPYSYAIGCKFPDKARNIYIFSGTPALYDDEVLAFWPYEVKKDTGIAEMQKLAQDLFFSNLSNEDLTNLDITDSMMNNCFGLGQDFRLRCMDWGFRLSDVKQPVFMRHSKADESVPFKTAELTAKLLPNCRFEAKENDVHFSPETLDDFIKSIIAPQL